MTLQIIFWLWITVSLWITTTINWTKTLEITINTLLNETHLKCNELQYVSMSVMKSRNRSVIDSLKWTWLTDSSSQCTLWRIYLWCCSASVWDWVRIETGIWIIVKWERSYLLRCRRGSDGQLRFWSVSERLCERCSCLWHQTCRNTHIQSHSVPEHTQSVQYRTP